MNRVMILMRDPFITYTTLICDPEKLKTWFSIMQTLRLYYSTIYSIIYTYTTQIRFIKKKTNNNRVTYIRTDTVK